MSNLKSWFVRNFIVNIKTCPVPVPPRMYLILREDLAYKYIQGGHALAQYALDHPENFKIWGNMHLICLSVFNGVALDDLNDNIGEEFHKSSIYEPDLGNKLTAIAIFESGSGDVARLVKPLRLATK